MGVFGRFRRRRKAPYAALTDEERMSRYVYLLNTMPASVIERAHAAAFAEVPLQRRIEMLDELRPFMSDSERDQAAEPVLLARLVRRAEERKAERAAVATLERVEPEHRTGAATLFDPRDMLARNGVMALVAYHFVASTVVHSYFTVGAGSLALGGEPGWVADIGDPGAAAGAGFEGGGFDAGGGYDGGGGDGGGGFGGDVGGFGGFGGFDGGGGFG